MLLLEPICSIITLESFTVLFEKVLNLFVLTVLALNESPLPPQQYVGPVGSLGGGGAVLPGFGSTDANSCPLS